MESGGCVAVPEDGTMNKFAAVSVWFQNCYTRSNYITYPKFLPLDKLLNSYVILGYVRYLPGFYCNLSYAGTGGI